MTTEQGARVGRFRLDLEINDEEDPGYTDRLIEGLELRYLGEQPFVPGGNFPTHRFQSGNPDVLLELAHRWVGVGTEAHNPDAWEMVAIVDLAQGGVELPLRVDAGLITTDWRDRRVFTDAARLLIGRRPGPEDGRFNLLNLSVRVTAPTSWADEHSREVGDQILESLRGEIEVIGRAAGDLYPGVEVEVEL